MDHNYFFLLSAITTFFIITIISKDVESVTFYDNYYPYWGTNHFKLDKSESQEEVQLLIDPYSGSGFKSKWNYESGLFHVKMKIPYQKTGGIVPCFYLISNFDGKRDELDFEFMGTRGLLQTNIFTDGLGGREQRYQLPFDPSMDFHTYSILWNRRHVVFFVDEIPIRVHRNDAGSGVKYPKKPMRVEGTLWNSSWTGKVDWSLGPFVLKYRDFNNITACSNGPSNSNILKNLTATATVTGVSVGNREDCFSSKFFWNDKRHSELSRKQKQTIKRIRRTWMVYDYCKNKRSSSIYPECSRK